MAKHYYQIDLKSGHVLEEEDLQELEDAIRAVVGDAAGVFVEYVDSEG